MRRIAVYFSDDILMEEIIAMAREHGFHVRHVDSMTVVDRVPGIVRKEPVLTVVHMRKTK
jgi:hypothetical protein